jgi:hypothetical protein
MNRTQIEPLWTLLGQTWGAKFLEQYGTNPNDAWTSALAHISPEAARHALQQLIREASAFPPTLPEFIGKATDYRPPASTQPLIGDERKRVYCATTEELRRNASAAVSGFDRYREYETWRGSNTKGGHRPPHHTPDSPDWLYLQRLAWIEASDNNRRTTDAAGFNG